jgi:MarR family transcriptional regulator for hemolysin
MKPYALRARHRRGPKTALPVDEATPPRRISDKARFGGFEIDQATLHLQKFYADIKPGERDEIFFRTTRALVVAARRWRKLTNDRIKSIGQNMARWETLYLMACWEEELSQGELAKVVGVEGPTMVHMLNALERDGLIERHQSAVDRRVTHNRITEKGRQATRDIMAITNDVRAELLRDIDPAKLAVALDVLESIHRKLDDLC